MSKILAFVEVRENKIKNNGFEVASAASRFAKELQCEAEVLIVGNGVKSLTARAWQVWDKQSIGL